MEKTVKLLAAAGVLMLLAGAIFGFMRQWICAGLLLAGAFGCLIAALNFRNRKKGNREGMNINDALSALPPFFDPDGRLLSLPAKHKKKLLALWYLAGKLEAGGSMPKRS